MFAVSFYSTLFTRTVGDFLLYSFTLDGPSPRGTDRGANHFLEEVLLPGPGNDTEEWPGGVNVQLHDLLLR